MQKGEPHQFYLADDSSKNTHQENPLSVLGIKCLYYMSLMSFYLSHDLRENTGPLDKVMKYCSDMFQPWAASGGTKGRVEG